MKFYLNIAAFYILLIFSCKNKESVLPLPSSRIDLITNGNSKTWILNDIIQNSKSIIENCAKDDEYTFEKTDSKAFYNPKNKCYSNDDSRTFTYKLDDLLPIIELDGLEYIIDELSAKKLIISYEPPETNVRKLALKPLHHPQKLTLIAK